ncbi:lipase secretion chaperone [Vibrio sp. VPAP30]|uniref:lipase secretion chaperone n=1 Tax=Vibrio sp. VPAP30 TaxID=1647102 RepID=UPI00065A32F0|nr:lipase secretion chaperone [Vibrio sp. VPAP30]KLN63243.1 lipase chaperone [Vibrio sp. VPAP30]
MKKTALITATLVISIGLGTVLYKSASMPDSLPVAPSQVDIEVDTTTAKHFFDFSLSSLGEQSLNDIKKTVRQHVSTGSNLTDEEALFTTYLQYKEALADLEPMQVTSLTAIDLEQLHLRIMDLQSQYFSQEQIKLLFEDENLLRQLAIDKASIAQQDINNMQKQVLIEDRLIELPEHIRKAESNNQLVVNLASVSRLESQEKYLARVELIGEKAAQRLTALDQQRASFQSSLDSYLQRRDSLLASPSLSEQDKQFQINQLREQNFDTTQLRRVQALERIHDSR